MVEKDKCMNCNKEIPMPVFKFGGRKYGKNISLFYYNLRQKCCSDECFSKMVEKIFDELLEALYG